MQLQGPYVDVAYVTVCKTMRAECAASGALHGCSICLLYVNYEGRVCSFRGLTWM